MKLSIQVRTYLVNNWILCMITDYHKKWFYAFAYFDSSSIFLFIIHIYCSKNIFLTKLSSWEKSLSIRSIEKISFRLQRRLNKISIIWNLPRSVSLLPKHCFFTSSNGQLSTQSFLKLLNWISSCESNNLDK